MVSRSRLVFFDAREGPASRESLNAAQRGQGDEFLKVDEQIIPIE